jgi:hypothetical protein
MPVFSHGQLYIALSRTTLSNHITVLLQKNSIKSKTDNVVCPEVLLQ